jgi:serine/threonine-protein kinase
VHRDVKPDNAVLVARGGGETLKLVDFGLASDEAATEKLTATGVAFGTPAYLSPEMATGAAVDGRADLYAAGVMLFEMLAGRRPFEGADAAALLRAHATEPPPSPRAVAPDAEIPPPVEAVILRALTKDPAERHAGAAQMKQALLRAVGGEGVDEDSRAPVESLTLGSTRRRALLVAAAVALLAAATALAFALVR